VVLSHCFPRLSPALGNLPYNLLNIEEMVAYAQAISEKYGIRFHAYREAELKELGCNAILLQSPSGYRGVQRLRPLPIYGRLFWKIGMRPGTAHFSFF